MIPADINSSSLLETKHRIIILGIDYLSLHEIATVKVSFICSHNGGQGCCVSSLLSLSVDLLCKVSDCCGKKRRKEARVLEIIITLGVKDV